MPCIICRETLAILPCEHRTGVISGEFELDHIVVNKGSWYQAKESMLYIEGYKELHDRCPCKNCLIKTICAVGDHAGEDICDLYKSIMDSVKKLYGKSN